MPDYTGFTLRIPGGSSFAGYLPRYSQRANYVTAMATVSETPTASFDPGALYIPRLVTSNVVPIPCFMSAFFAQSSEPPLSNTSYTDCFLGSTVYPTVTRTTSGPTGLQTPNANQASGNAEAKSQWDQPTFPALVTTGQQTFNNQFMQVTSLLTPGTLLPGNQWYCTASWSALPMTWSATFAGSGAIGIQPAIPANSATAETGLYLMDYSAGINTAPTVTPVTALDSRSLTYPSSSFTIGANSVNIPLGMTLPSSFIIGVGVIFTAASFNGSPTGGIGVTFFGTPGQFTVNITQAP